MGKMGWVGRKAAATFCSTGTPSLFLHPSEAMHGDLGIVANDDLIVALSNSGETEELLALLPYIKRQGLGLIALTGKPQSMLARQANLVIDISVSAEADTISDAPTASTTAAMAMCDALAVALMQARGFNRDQFAIFHPGGYLGRKMLLTTADLMHRGERLPKIHRRMPLREAILVISQKALGCGFVVDESDHLCGILTDGDLRRIFAAHENPLTDSVELHYKPNPHRVAGELLAAETLRLMEQHSIAVVPVVDDDLVLIGAIHLHDLLRAGLA
jgi:arabinose-5-phosphate isomerase